jgi:integrase
MEVSKGRELADVLSEYVPNCAEEAEISVFVARWLKLFRQKVKAGDRQPRTLHELERWAKKAGRSNWWAWWYGKSIWEIDRGALTEWSYWLADQELGGKTRRNVMAGFSSFISWLPEVRRGFELPRIPWPEADRPLPKVLSREVQGVVIEAVPQKQRGIYYALADCLLRPSEARVLRLRDWTGDELRVERAAKDRKTQGTVRGVKRRGGEKVLPVSPRLADWLEKHVTAEHRIKGPDAPLFLNPEGHTGWWSETALRRVWYLACDRSGVERIGVYCGTKHSTATALKAAGADDRVLATLMGHSDVRSVEKYAHVQASQIRSTLAILEPHQKRVSDVCPEDSE